MRNNPERLAWTVMSLAFVTFCVLVTTIPLGIRSYLLGAMEVQETQVQRIAGTVLVRRVNGGQLGGVIESGVVMPGEQVIIDSATRAVLDLFDRSHVTLYSNTTLALLAVESPRFALSDEPNRIRLNLMGGLARVGVALPLERDTLFEVVTPHTTVSLAEGSYRIEVTSDATQVTVLRGEARLPGGNSVVSLVQGMRCSVGLDGLPSEPLAMARNLIVNGDFQQPLSSSWVTGTIVLASGVQPPTVAVVEDGGRNAVQLVRRQPDDGNHTQVSIQQRIDRDVRDFDQLQITLDVLINYQSLSGGGQLSSEFPVIVWLDYKDQWGNDQFWTHGFYHQNDRNFAIATDAWGRPLGEQIPQGVWFPYESGNLMELLGDSKPVHITGIKVYASGWNYDSLVSEVQLVVE
jgi:hypothetical protein